jgi:hypothetical protein
MGLGYSPLLASLVLIECMNKWKNNSSSNEYITYGDDGIIFFEEEGEYQKFQEILSASKIDLNMEKSE